MAVFDIFLGKNTAHHVQYLLNGMTFGVPVANKDFDQSQEENYIKKIW